MSVPEGKRVECPDCGADAFQELSYRWTWQPVTVELDAAGVLDQVEYGSFDYGDDCHVSGVECRECGACWVTYEDLAKNLRGEEHKRGELSGAEVFAAPE